MKAENVHIKTMPDHYVGAFVTVTIGVRNKDKNLKNIESLRKRIELDISTMNALDSNKFI